MDAIKLANERARPRRPAPYTGRGGGAPVNREGYGQYLRSGSILDESSIALLATDLPPPKEYTNFSSQMTSKMTSKLDKDLSIS